MPGYLYAVPVCLEIFNILKKISGRFISASKMVSNYTALDISLDRKVTITESFIPEFSLSSFFADLGGSLGLWLGVGVVQLLTSGLGLLTCVKRYLNLN